MSEEVNKLNAALASHGTPATIRRNTGTPAVPVYSDVACMAAIRPWRNRGPDPDDLIANLAQKVDLVVISPTPLVTAKWPTGSGTVTLTTVTLPRREDTFIVSGETKTIEAAEAIRIKGEVVRIELQVRG